MTVSAVLVTRGRQAFAAQALQCFVSQYYAERELIVIDDADEPSFPCGLNDPIIRYVLNPDRRSIPQKRNQAAELAHGELIMHFDSDDWSSPDRMAAQVSLMMESGKAVSGFHTMFFKAEQLGQWWLYRGADNFALGTSLCYRREWFMSHRFDESLETGEDNSFVKATRRNNDMISVSAGPLMFARIHAHNTSVKKFGGAVTEYRSIPVESVPQEFLF